MVDAVQTNLGHRLSFHDRVLEPSAGDGAFVLPLVERIAASIPHDGWQSADADNSLVAFETNPAHAETLRHGVLSRLRSAGCPPERAASLVTKWIREEDFLSAAIHGRFDVVLGNPPYIRYDAIDERHVIAYQHAFSTFRGRCDLYVPFIERALSLLAPDGTFCFICSNRFTKSEYGDRLRSFISAGFHVALFLNLEHANVFGKGVAAYPAILMIDRRKGNHTFAATATSLDSTPLHFFRFSSSTHLDEFPDWYHGDEPWMTTSSSDLRHIRQINGKLPALEDSAPYTRFGIGVSTGCDEVFVRPGLEPGVEKDCLLPLVTGDDVRSGKRWGGSYLVNPFRPDSSGAIRDLSERPGLASYLKRHKAKLSTRFVAQHKEWFRTIDRINWPLFRTPKILLPDIQLGGVVGIDHEGGLYPHHNLYWIVSQGWPLDLLAAILASSFVTQQIRWVSSEVRGGGIRYQVKNLRRLRLPPRGSVSVDEEKRLVAAFGKKDSATVDHIVDFIVERHLKTAKPTCVHFTQQLLFEMAE